MHAGLYAVSDCAIVRKVSVKAETGRTRFTNATRIFDFQRPLNSVLFYFSPIFERTSAIKAIWCTYIAKLLSVDGFICF